MPVYHFTDGNFEEEVLSAKQPVLVDFWASWCGPCRRQGPIVDEVEKEISAENLGKVGKVNVDEERALAEQYGISSIPTLMLFKNGQVAEKFVGVTQKETIVGLFRKQKE